MSIKRCTLFSILSLYSTLAVGQTDTKLPTTLPIKHGTISSWFGHRISPFTSKTTFHEGLDIVAPLNTPIYAPADGIVTEVGKLSGLGNYFVLTHISDVSGRYGHVKDIKVKKGQRVKRGAVLARVGMTGRTTGAHLHYELRIKDTLVNPMTFIMEIPNTQSSKQYDGIGGEYAKD